MTKSPPSVATNTNNKEEKTLWEKIVFISRRLQEFLSALALFIILPLVPMILEWTFAENLNLKNLYLSVSIFSITNAVSSRSFVIFCIGIVVSVLFAAALGWIPEQVEPTKQVFYETRGNLGLIIMALIFALEKANIHIFQGIPATSFQSRKNQNN